MLPVPTAMKILPIKMNSDEHLPHTPTRQDLLGVRHVKPNPPRPELLRVGHVRRRATRQAPYVRRITTRQAPSPHLHTAPTHGSLQRNAVHPHGTAECTNLPLTPGTQHLGLGFG